MDEQQKHPATERHYSPAEVAALWGIHPQSVRRIFRDRPGVMVLGSRKRIIVRIPESVLIAVHEERSKGFLAELKGRPELKGKRRK
jgi:hypothetical protein